MAIESKFHRPSPVDHVLVSQGTRNDAKPASGIRFETYCEERDHWIGVKRGIESELVGYSKAAFAGEQARIRRENSTDQAASFQAWISRKASMESKRQKLVKQKNRAEEELIRLKPLVKQENIRFAIASRPANKEGPGELEGFDLFCDNGTLSWNGVAAELLLELRAIRRLLEDQCRPDNPS